MVTVVLIVNTTSTIKQSSNQAINHTSQVVVPSEYTLQPNIAWFAEMNYSMDKQFIPLLVSPRLLEAKHNLLLYDRQRG